MPQLLIDFDREALARCELAPADLARGGYSYENTYAARVARPLAHYGSSPQ